MFAASRALRKLYQLPGSERRLLLQAALLLPAVYAAQTVLPFKRWRALLAGAAPWPDGDGPSDAAAWTQVTWASAKRARPPSHAEIAQAIERARKGVPGVYKCLPQAYAAHLLLRRYGYPSVVQVGVARDAKGGVEAHAWVELDGRVIIGALPDLSRFVPLPPLRV